MFFILFSLLIAPFSQAQTPAEENYKILGRGVRNSMTGEVLQLACIGAPKAGDLEASCEKMQFSYSAMGRPAALIGEPFSLKLLEDTQKFVSTRKFRAALKEQIISRGYLDTIDRQIITLLSKGLRNKTIASELGLSDSAVEKRKVKIKDYLNIYKGNDEDIITECRKLGFI